MSLPRLTLVVLALGLLLVTPLPGCWMVAAGAGAAAGSIYTSGALETQLEATPAEITEAAGETLVDMGTAILSASSTTFDGKVVARTADDTRITVTVRSAGAAQGAMTTVIIRYGILGDEAKCRVILEGIRARL